MQEHSYDSVEFKIKPVSSPSSIDFLYLPPPLTAEQGKENFLGISRYFLKNDSQKP